MKNNMLLMVMFALTIFFSFFIGRKTKNTVLTNRTVIIDTLKVDTMYVPKLTKSVKTNWITEKYYVDVPMIKDLTQKQIDSIIALVSKDRLVSIADDYFTKRTYDDTLSDSNMVVYIKDSLFMNSITNRRFTSKIIRKTTIEEKPRRLVFDGGIFLGGNRTSFDFGVGAGITTKKGVNLRYQYNMIDRSNYVTIGSVIKFRK